LNRKEEMKEGGEKWRLKKERNKECTEGNKDRKKN